MARQLGRARSVRPSSLRFGLTFVTDRSRPRIRFPNDTDSLEFKDITLMQPGLLLDFLVIHVRLHLSWFDRLGGHDHEVHKASRSTTGRSRAPGSAPA